MIPKKITEDLRNGMGLEECLIKHETNLKTLFHRVYPDEIRCDPKWKYIEKKGANYYIKKKKYRSKSTYYYGIYRTLEDAQKVRDELIFCGWKQNKVDSICKKVGVERIPGKNEQRYSEVTV